MTQDEALDLALKTLRSVAGELYRVTSYCDTYDALAETNNAIMDIQQARSAPVQEPEAWPCLIAEADFSQNTMTLTMQCEDYKVSARQHWLSTTPPVQPAPVQEPVRWSDYEPDGRRYPAVPDAFGTREGEHPQYIQGWNDCRQAMLEVMK